jgi:homoserine dehydrogenase
MRDSLIVLKFGSSVLRIPTDLDAVVAEVARQWRGGRGVIAVVSALAGATDRLIEQAQNFGRVDDALVARLLATAEAKAAALLGLATNRAGLPVVVTDAASMGLVTTREALDAMPIALDAERIRAQARRCVVIVPGFVGRSADGAATLLGRGGSDLTALFLARELNAPCTLIKDVDGIFDRDPAAAPHSARCFATIPWASARAIGGKVVQPKAVSWAERHALEFRVAALSSSLGTTVGPYLESWHPHAGRRLAGPARGHCAEEVTA